MISHAPTYITLLAHDATTSGVIPDNPPGERADRRDTAGPGQRHTPVDYLHLQVVEPDLARTFQAQYDVDIRAILGHLYYQLVALPAGAPVYGALRQTGTGTGPVLRWLDLHPEDNVP